ncbi:MAG TPA: chemotaxis protein CheD [Cellvibrio sp.]|jgi:chemotaxis protein CheD|nr:chemotaxis protein CheD [Cellvibrio sp.]
MPADKLLSIHPGDWYFGTGYSRLHTVLGSCVALTAWHPALKLGGMCHFLLPQPPVRSRTTAPDCRYAEHALFAMKRSMLRYGEMRHFVIGLFGGGDMFTLSGPSAIGENNIEYARHWLARERLAVQKIDVGGTVSRSLTLYMQTGEIHLKHYDSRPANRA